MCGIADRLHRVLQRDPQFHLVYYQCGQIGQQLSIAGGKLVGDGIDRTKGTEHEPFRRRERRTSVKPNGRVGRDEWIIPEPRIFRGVLDDEYTVIEDGMSAERDIARGFRCLQTMVRFKPLPVSIDERHQRDGDTDCFGDNLRDPVECGFRRRVQNVVPVQPVKPFCVRPRVRANSRWRPSREALLRRL